MTEHPDSFDARGTITVGARELTIYRLGALQAEYDVARLPYSLKVLLENLPAHGGQRFGRRGRHRRARELGCTGGTLAGDRLHPCARRHAGLTGVPAIVDLAAMRDAMAALGGDPSKINPLVPAELVIDTLRASRLVRIGAVLRAELKRVVAHQEGPAEEAEVTPEVPQAAAEVEA